MLVRSRESPPQEAEVRKRHIVVLSEQERARLHTLIGRGVAPVSALTHARVLLKANQGEAGPGWTDAAIGAALEVNPATVARVRMRYVAAGLDAAVYRKPPARQYRRRLDGEQEAYLAALACSAPPQGRKRWTLRLLADQLVESVSYETVRQVLTRTYLIFGTGRVADRGLCRCAGGGSGVLSGYLRVSGTGVPSSWKARAWTGVGVGSFWMRCPAKMMTWRVRVARWASRS